MLLRELQKPFTQRALDAQAQLAGHIRRLVAGDAESLAQLRGDVSECAGVRARRDVCRLGQRIEQLQRERVGHAVQPWIAHRVHVQHDAIRDPRFECQFVQQPRTPHARFSLDHGALPLTARREPQQLAQAAQLARAADEGRVREMQLRRIHARLRGTAEQAVDAIDELGGAARAGQCVLAQQPRTARRRAPEGSARRSGRCSAATAADGGGGASFQSSGSSRSSRAA